MHHERSCRPGDDATDGDYASLITRGGIMSADRSKLTRFSLGMFAFLVALLSLVQPIRAQTNVLYGPGRPLTTCQISWGGPPLDCQNIYAMQVEVLVSATGQPVVGDPPCGPAGNVNPLKPL